MIRCARTARGVNIASRATMARYFVGARPRTALVIPLL